MQSSHGMRDSAKQLVAQVHRPVFLAGAASSPGSPPHRPTENPTAASPGMQPGGPSQKRSAPQQQSGSLTSPARPATGGETLSPGHPPSGGEKAAAVASPTHLHASPDVHHLRLIGQVGPVHLAGSPANERDYLLQKLAAHQRSEVSARIGRQRALELVNAAKLNAKKKLHYERMESGLHHEEVRQRDEIHREQCTTYLEVSFSVREGYFRETRGLIATAEGTARDGIKNAWLTEARALHQQSVLQATFLLRMLGIRDSEAQQRRYGGAAKEVQERTALQKQCVASGFATRRAVCQREEDEARDSIARLCACEYDDVSNVFAASCNSAAASTHERFWRERAAVEAMERRARALDVEAACAEALLRLMALGQRSLEHGQVSQFYREESEARAAVAAAESQVERSSLAEAARQHLQQQRQRQRLREEKERSVLLAAAVAGLKAAAQQEAVAGVALQQLQTADWRRVKGLLQCGDFMETECGAREVHEQQCVTSRQQMQVQARYAAERIAVVLAHREGARHVAAAEEESRARLALTASSEKVDARCRERARLLREAEQGRLRALRLQAQRSPPFLGLSLAEKVNVGCEKKPTAGGFGNASFTSLLSSGVSSPLNPAAGGAVQQPPGDDNDLVVDSLVANGPAIVAGIRLQDRIVSVAGVWSTSLIAVRSTIAQRAVVGSQIEIKIRRTLASRNAPDDATPDAPATSNVSFDSGSFASVAAAAVASAVLTFVVPVKTIDPQFAEIPEWFFDIGGEDTGDRIERGQASPGYAKRRTKSLIDKMGPPTRRATASPAVGVSPSEGRGTSPGASATGGGGARGMSPARSTSPPPAAAVDAPAAAASAPVATPPLAVPVPLYEQASLPSPTSSGAETAPGDDAFSSHSTPRDGDAAAAAAAARPARPQLRLKTSSPQEMSSDGYGREVSRSALAGVKQKLVLKTATAATRLKAPVAKRPTL